MSDFFEGIDEQVADDLLRPELTNQPGRDRALGVSVPRGVNRNTAEYLNNLPVMAHEQQMQAARNLELASAFLPGTATTAPEMMAEQVMNGLNAAQMMDQDRAFEGTLSIEGEKAMLEAFFEQINDWEERDRLWQAIPPERREQLLAAGFEPPSDPKPGGISIPFTSPFKKLYNWITPDALPQFGDGNLELSTGDNAPSNAINWTLNKGDDAVRAGVGGAINALEWVEETAVGQPFRAGQLGYRDSSVHDLGGGTLDQAMGASSLATGGLGGLLGSFAQSAYGLIRAGFQGNAGELWALAEDRDGTFTLGSISGSLDILDQDVMRHQMAMAYVANGNNYNAIIPAVEELTGLAPGMPGFADIYLEFEALVNPDTPDEQFLEATDLLFRNKHGLGITQATMAGLEPGSTTHNIYAGVTELGILMTLDPTLLAGKVNQVRKLATYAVQSGQAFNELRRARTLAHLARRVDQGEEITNLADQVRMANHIVDSNIRRSIGDRLFTNVDRQLEYGRQVDRVAEQIVRAFDPEDTLTLAEATRNAPAIGYMREQLVRASRNPDFNNLRTTDDVFDWMETGAGQRALSSGAVGRDPRFTALPRISERNEQWYQAKAWFRRKTDMSAAIPSDMRKDVEENVREFWDYNITIGEGSIGIRKAQDLDNRSLIQRGADSWFGLRTLGHRFVHQVPRANTLSAVTGGTDELDRAANEAIRNFERFVEFGDLVRMPDEVKANYVEKFTMGNEAERWIAIRSFVSEMTLRTGMADSSDKVQEIMRRYGFALDQEFGVAQLDKVDDIRGLTARDVINHNAIWNSQTSTNIAIPDFKRVRRSLQQNWAVRMWGSMFEDVIDAQMTRWWRPTVLFRLGFIPRAAGEETTSFILRLGSMSYIRAQYGIRWAMGASKHPATGVWTAHSELSPTMRAFYAMGWQLKKWSQNTPRHTIDAARSRLADAEKWRVKTLENTLKVTTDGQMRQGLRDEIADLLQPHITAVRAERGRASRSIEAVANSAMNSALRASPLLYKALRAAKIPSRQDMARMILGIDFRGLGRNGLPVADDVANPFGTGRMPNGSEWWSQADGTRLVLAEYYSQHVPAISRTRNQAMGHSYDPYQTIGTLAETTGTLTGQMPLTPVTGRFGRQRYIQMRTEHLGMDMIDITDGDFRRSVGQAMLYPAADPVFRESGALVAMSSYVGNRTRAALRGAFPGKFRSNAQILEYLEGSRRTIARYMTEGEHLDALNMLKRAIITNEDIPEAVVKDLETPLGWLMPILNSTDDMATRNRVRGMLFPDVDILHYPVTMDYFEMVADVHARLWRHMSRPDYQESMKTLATMQANEGVALTAPLGPDSTRLYTVLIDPNDIELLRTFSATAENYEDLSGEMLRRLWTERTPAQRPLRQPRYPSNEAVIGELENLGLTIEDWSEARRMLDGIRENVMEQAKEADESIDAWLDNFSATTIRYPPPANFGGEYDFLDAMDASQIRRMQNEGFFTTIDNYGNTQNATPDTITMWYNTRMGTDLQQGEVMEIVLNQMERLSEIRYFIKHGRLREGGYDFNRLVDSSDFQELGLDLNQLLQPGYWDMAAIKLAESIRSAGGDMGLIDNIFTGEEAQRHIFAKTVDAMESSGLELEEIDEIIHSITNNSTLQPGSWLDALLKQRDAMPEGESLGRIPALGMQFSDPYVAEKVSEALDAAMDRVRRIQGDQGITAARRQNTSLGYYDHWTEDLYTDEYLKIGQRSGEDLGSTAIYQPTNLDRMAFEPPVEIDRASMVEFKETQDGLWFTEEQLASRADHGRHDKLTGRVQWATGQTEHAAKRNLATQRVEYLMELFTGEDQEVLSEVLPLLKNNVFDTEFHTLGIPSQDLITEAAKPLTEEIPLNWFQRLTGSYFSDVVDPVMQAVIRNVLFNHNMAEAMPQAEEIYHMAISGQTNDWVLDMLRRSGIEDDTIDGFINQLHLTFGVEPDGDEIRTATETLSTMLANPQGYDGVDIVDELLRINDGTDSTRLAAQDVLDEIVQARQESILMDADGVEVLRMENDIVQSAGAELRTIEQLEDQIRMIDNEIELLAEQGVNRKLGDYDVEDLAEARTELQNRLDDVEKAEALRQDQLAKDREFVDQVQEYWEERLAADTQFEWTVEEMFEGANVFDDPRERMLYMLHAPIDRSRRTMLDELQSWSATRYHSFQQAMESAAVRATDMSVEFIDDHRFKSQFQQTVGNLMPFWFAQEQFIKRSLRMLYDSPESIRRASLLMNAGRQMGLIQTDAEGNEIFVYPGTQHINAGLLRFAGLMTGMEGLHVYAQPMSAQTQFMLPGYGGASTGSYFDDSLGFGPFVGFSTAFLADMFPELEVLDRTLNRNEVAQGRKPLEHFLPPSVMRLLDLTGIDMLSTDRMANAQIRAMQMAHANGTAPPPDASPLELEQFRNRTRQWARIINIMDAGLYFGGPFPSGNRVGYGDLEVQNAFHRMVFQSGLPWQEGMALFLETYPDATAWTVFGSENVTGAPIASNAEQYQWLDEHGDLVTNLPYAASWLMVPISQQGDEFNVRAREELFEYGLKRDRTPDEFLEEIYFSQAANAFYPELEQFDMTIYQLEASGADSELIAQVKDQRATFVDMFENQHPIFAANRGLNGDGYARRQQTDIERRQILAMPRDELPQGSHADDMLELMAGHQQFIDAMEAMKGQDGREAQEQRQNLRIQFLAWAQNYATTHPSTQPYFGSNIRWDDRILDGGLEVIIATEALTGSSLN